MSKPLLANPKRARLKRSPLKRRARLKRSTSLRKAKPSVKGAQAKQRRAVKERAGLFCEFREGLGPLAVASPAMRCLARGVDCAHIFPRRLCGKARDLPEVVVLACREHHRRYDAGDLMVRVPAHLASTARTVILMLAKDPVSVAKDLDRVLKVPVHP
jgi:hypothetical protein